MDVYLEKVDPDRNCFRFYAIRTEADFFQEASLVVQWGRIGRIGNVRVRGSGDIDNVEILAQKILKKRLLHGYASVEEGLWPRP